MYSKNDYRYYLENRLIHSDDFLAHYGVVGMKWGVRKAEAYRTKELARLDKIHEHQMNKRAKKQNRLDKKLSKKPTNSKLANKSAKNKQAQKYIDAMYKAERKSLKKMNPDELRAEKKAVTKEHLKDAAISGAVTAGSFGLAATGVTPGFLVYGRKTDTRGLKTNRRVSQEEVNKIKTKFGETPKEYRPVNLKSDRAYNSYMKKLQKSSIKEVEKKNKQKAREDDLLATGQYMRVHYKDGSTEMVKLF